MNFVARSSATDRCKTIYSRKSRERVGTARHASRFAIPGENSRTSHRRAPVCLPCVKDAAGGSDNLPTVIAEAMAAGLPVVSTSIAGIPEMVEHNVTGELVPPNDPRALAVRWSA